MVDFTTVARPYARAAFDVAAEAGELESWSAALAAAAQLVADPAARAYLGNPALQAGQRAEFLAGLCSSVDGGAALASGAGRNLLNLLAENDRLQALGEISAQFDELRAERENRVKVTLTAASAVDAAQAEKVAAALKRRLGRDIELEVEIDPALIGGAVIRAQDMVIDDSVKARLERLTGALVD